MNFEEYFNYGTPLLGDSQWRLLLPFLLLILALYLGSLFRKTDFYKSYQRPFIILGTVLPILIVVSFWFIAGITLPPTLLIIIIVLFAISGYWEIKKVNKK